MALQFGFDPAAALRRVQNFDFLGWDCLDVGGSGWLGVLLRERRGERIGAAVGRLAVKEHDGLGSRVVDPERLGSLNKDTVTCLTDILSLMINRRSMYFCWQVMRLYFYGRPCFIDYSNYFIL